MRRRITLAIDIFCLVVATCIAITISNGAESLLTLMDIMSVVIAVVVNVIVLRLSKSYRAIIRHLDSKTILRISLAVLFGSLLWIMADYYLRAKAENHLNLFLLQCFFSLVLLIGYRVVLYLYIGKEKRDSKPATGVAIFGLSDEAKQLASSLSISKKYKMVFFFVEDQALGGGLVDGIRVYSEDHFDWAVQRFQPSIFVFPQGKKSAERHAGLIKRLLDANIEVKMFDGLEASLDKNLIMEVARPIEIEDLLGREENPIAENLFVEAVEGRHILVTGAAGSIGSQLCRRISALKPASLSMMDIDESGLVAVRDEIASNVSTTKLYLGSIADRNFVDRMIATSGADTIVHAAAYKHVSMGEECVRSVVENNIQGTFNLVEAAKGAGVERFIQVSTDKAVEPSSVMGATKMWCEKIVSAYASPDNNRYYASVRFGNVIESRGSVIPKFKEQIVNGGPVTVTDEKMQRFFMSIDEAVDLIVQSIALTKGGEVFVLDMGSPHFIMDVAKSVIQLAGKTVKPAPDQPGDIEIVITGGYDAEKLEEKLSYDGEHLTESVHPSIRITDGNQFSSDELRKMKDALFKIPNETSEDNLRDLLFTHVKKFEAAIKA